MSEDRVDEALARLRRGADRAYAGWLPKSWRKVEGPGPDSVEMTPFGIFSHPYGAFPGLELPRAGRVVLEADLHLPEEIAGVPVAGDPLLMTTVTMFPVDFEHDGRQVFTDGLPVAASGPALVEVLPELRAGANGALRAGWRLPDHEIAAGMNWLHFTTPRLRERFHLLDVAWAQLALARAFGRSADDLAVVDKAAGLVPDDLEDEASLAALEQMAEVLSPLDERVKAITVHLVGHSHIDMNWMWTWPDTVEIVKRDFRSVLALMDEFPEMTFVHSQAATYRIIEQDEPELFADVKRHIAEGRWEPATMQWVEGDVNMASGESQARHMLEAVHYTRDHLGAEPVVFLAPDTFGHAGQVPQIATSAGARYYFHGRCNPGQDRFNAGGPLWPLYWWEGDDGSRILAMTPHAWYAGQITAGEMARGVISGALPHGWEHVLHFHGIGDHGGGPSRQNMLALRRLQEEPLLPTLLCSTPSGFADAMLASGAVLPVHRGESATTFEGCYTTHADTKRYNRHGENLLQSADTFAALAGLDRREEMSEAWRKILFNQFHDIFDGSAIHDVYLKNGEDFEGAAATAAAVSGEALAALEAGLEPGSVAVHNPLGWAREELVLAQGLPGDGPVWLEGPSGERVPGQRSEDGRVAFVARVPAFGAAAYRVAGAAPAPGPMQVRPWPSGTMDASPYFEIENDFYRACIRRDCGVILSYFDKLAGRELCGWLIRRTLDLGPGFARPDLGLNVLQVIDEDPHPMSAWTYVEVRGEQSLIRGATTELVEHGPVRTVLEVTHRVRSSTFRQRIVLAAGSPRIDFETFVDWQEPSGPEVGIPNLRVAFTGDTEGAEAWFETPFGAVRRRGNGQEVPALRWADVGGPDYGFAVMNDCKHGHDVLGPRVRLNLVRTGYDPDRASDIGEHRFTYSFLAHQGDWRSAEVPKRAAELNQPLVARVVGPQAAGSRAAALARVGEVVTREGVVAAQMKVAQSGSGRIIRFYEATGRRGSARIANLSPGTRVFDCSITEDRIRELPAAGGAVEIHFRPFEIRTILLADG